MDRLIAYGEKLPRPDAWRLDPESIPMRDGVRLKADLYTPGVPSKGVILIRSPYGRRVMAWTDARMLAGQGYTVLLVSSRGTAGSQGVFSPMMDESDDGQDVVTWMREQPWYPGRFATYGHSYLGHTQWALLEDPPTDLAACVVLEGPHDFARHTWGSGTFYTDQFGWSQMQRVMANSLSPAVLSELIRTSKPASKLLDGVPIRPVADAFLPSWIHDRLTHPDLSDPFWTPMRHGTALEKTTVPTLIIAGWQDIFFVQSMEQYARLHRRGTPTRLVVGAWTHLDMDQSIASRAALDWLGAHLAGSGTGHEGVDVEVTPTGAWMHLDTWPPQTTPLTLFPQTGHRLTDGAPADGDESFVFDPDDPTPTIGGNHLADGGFKDDSALAGRRDLLCFDSRTLPKDLLVAGAPHVELAHSTQRHDCDLFVRISDVDPAGRSTNVTEAYKRFVGSHDGVALDLLDTAHLFRAGHRLRLVVAGGSFPAWARNPGTGENPVEAPRLYPNRHTVSFGQGTALTLPVMT